MGDGAGQDSPIHRVVAKKAGEFIKHRLSYTFSPAFPRSVQLDHITSLHESSHTIPSQAQSCFIGISIKSPPSCPHSFHNPYPSPPPTHLPHPSPTPPTPILIRKLLRHFLPTQHQPYSPKPPPPLSPNTSPPTIRRVKTYPVAFSNMPRAPSVTFSFMPRCFSGSTLPWPNFFSMASRPVMGVSSGFDLWGGERGRMEEGIELG